MDPSGWVASKLPEGWDWTNPDYDAILRRRYEMLDFLRRTEGALAAALRSYAKPWGFYDFIFDWGRILDPRDSAFGRDPDIPFALFPRQVECLTWMATMLSNPAQGKPGSGNISKTRGCGASTMACFYSLWLWRFRPNSHIGVGSNLERNVYDKENPKALFWKLDHGLMSWPEEFLPKGFRSREHMMKGAGAGKLVNPENRSTITGDAGPDIGRGDRKLVYFIDEHRSLQHPVAAEAGLAKTTNSLIRISTERRDSLFHAQVEGLRKHSPENLFEYKWQDDPRMTPEVFEAARAQAEALGMLDIFRVEVECDLDSVVVDTFMSRGLLENAATRQCLPSGPAIISIDVAAQGNDSSMISWRRGLWHSALRKYPKSSNDGKQLAAEVLLLAEEILTQNIPIAAVIYELEGSGYALHSVLQGSPLAEICEPIHPGAKLSNGRHYNVRAQGADLMKRAIENGAMVPNDQELIRLGSQIKVVPKEDVKGRKMLLLENKKAFRKRLANDPTMPQTGPSPDAFDNVAISYVPVEQHRFTLSDYRKALGRAESFAGPSELEGSYGWVY